MLAWGPSLSSSRDSASVPAQPWASKKGAEAQGFLEPTASPASACQGQFKFERRKQMPHLKEEDQCHCKERGETAVNVFENNHLNTQYSGAQRLEGIFTKPLPSM